MNEQTYSQWQILHSRTAAGEPLNAAEQAEYEAGCQEIDNTVSYDNDLQRLRDLRDQVLEARAVGQQLRESEIQADAKIAELESRLDLRTRQLLGIEN